MHFKFKGWILSISVCSSFQLMKLITFTICGRAYLNFMGNEFGHPDVRLFTIYIISGSLNLFPLSFKNSNLSFRCSLITLIVFFVSRGLSSQCQQTTTHFHWLIADGIY